MFILKIMNVNNCLNDETMTAVNAMNGQKDDNEYNEELDTSVSILIGQRFNRNGKTKCEAIYLFYYMLCHKNRAFVESYR